MDVTREQRLRSSLAWLLAERPDELATIRAAAQAFLRRRVRGLMPGRRCPEDVVALLTAGEPSPEDAEALLAAHDGLNEVLRLGLETICDGWTIGAIAAVITSFEGTTLKREWYDRHGGILATGRRGAEALVGQPPSTDSLLHLQAWAQANHPHVDWEISQGTLETMLPSVLRFDQLARLYPDAWRLAKEVRVERIPLQDRWTEEDKHWARRSWAQYLFGRFSFNVDRYGPDGDLVERLERLGDDDWTRASDLAGIVTHEFGHHLHGYLLGDLGDASRYEGDRHCLLLFPRERALAPYLDGPVGTTSGMLSLWLEEHGEAISPYAQVNAVYSERFAEGFTSLLHDPPSEQPEFARALGRVIDRLLSTPAVPAAKLSTLADEEALRAYQQHLRPLLAEFDLTPQMVERQMAAAFDWAVDLPDLEGELAGRYREKVLARQAYWDSRVWRTPSLHVVEPLPVALPERLAALGGPPSLSGLDSSTLAAPAPAQPDAPAIDR